MVRYVGKFGRTRYYAIDITKDGSLLQLDMSRTWDYRSKDRPMTTIGQPNASYGPPRGLIYSGLSYDATGNFLIDGGGLAEQNASRDDPLSAVPIQSSSWTLSSNNGSWLSSVSKFTNSVHAPMHGLYAQAPEQDLVFSLNPVLTDGSSEQIQLKMMILNTRTNGLRTVSTDFLSPTAGRVGAVFQYLPLLGRKGGLLLFGGAMRNNSNMTADHWNDMVISIFPKTASLNLTAIPDSIGLDIYVRYCLTGQHNRWNLASSECYW